MARGSGGPRPRSTVLMMSALILTVIRPGPPAGAPALASAAWARRACPALGLYPVGPRLAQAHVAARPARQRQPPLSPWRLAGTLRLTAFRGCGHPTAGTFAVAGDLLGQPVQSGGITVTVPCAASCWGPPLAVISATGTFQQDGAHPDDALYVRVRATLISAQPRVPVPASCLQSCPLGPPTRLAFRAVTGYVQVAPGAHVTLSFFPPPPVSVSQLPLAVVIYGWRGL